MPFRASAALVQSIAQAAVGRSSAQTRQGITRAKADAAPETNAATPNESKALNIDVAGRAHPSRSRGGRHHEGTILACLQDDPHTRTPTYR